jgi:hypothetical protein
MFVEHKSPTYYLKVSHKFFSDMMVNGDVKKSHRRRNRNGRCDKKDCTNNHENPEQSFTCRVCFTKINKECFDHGCEHCALEIAAKASAGE